MLAFILGSLAYSAYIVTLVVGDHFQGQLVVIA